MLAKRTKADAERHFYDHGWVVVQLPNLEPIHEVRAALLAELRRLMGNDEVTLERYHEFVADDETHTELQIKMTEFYRGNGFNKKVLGAQMELFGPLVGPDLKVQRNPFLRMTRPNKPGDNIGFHRDTFYGGSPLELSVIVPYVDVPPEGSLALLSGSHIRPESDFRVTQVQSPDVVKGSAKHKLGFPYAPKLMDPAQLTDVTPVPINVGEALMLTLSCVHGSEVNRSQTTRWTTDIRIMHALAPVDLSMRPEFYEPLTQSVVTERAEAYFAAQR